jgi:glyoxylate/succinic semialdehyde reductase
MAEPIGFIGLGIMGGGMARCMLKAGIPLHVWTRNPEVSAALASEDANVKVCDSPAAVVSSCPRTYLMLPTPEACEAVYTQKDGVLEACAGKQLVDCATLRPDDMQQLAQRVQEMGGNFLEAPVSGSKGPAAQGALIFMAAGSRDVFDAATKELEAMGKASVFCSEQVGKASEMKLVVNMVMGAQLAALAEGIALADQLGLDSAALQGVLDGGAMASPLVKLKGPLMASRGVEAPDGSHGYPPAFPLKYALKDMRFALGLKGWLPMNVSSAAAEEYAKGHSLGHGDDDFAAVMEAASGKNN